MINDIIPLVVMGGLLATLAGTWSFELAQRLLGLVFGLGFFAVGYWAYTFATSFPTPSPYLKYVPAAIAGVCGILMLSLAAGWGVQSREDLV